MGGVVGRRESVCVCARVRVRACVRERGGEEGEERKRSICREKEIYLYCKLLNTIQIDLYEEGEERKRYI